MTKEQKRLQQVYLDAAELIASNVYTFSCNAIECGAKDIAAKNKFREIFSPFKDHREREVFWDDDIDKRNITFVSNPKECRIIALLLMAEIAKDL